MCIHLGWKHVLGFRVWAARWGPPAKRQEVVTAFMAWHRPRPPPRSMPVPSSQKTENDPDLYLGHFVSSEWLKTTFGNQGSPLETFLCARWPIFPHLHSSAKKRSSKFSHMKKLKSTKFFSTPQKTEVLLSQRFLNHSEFALFWTTLSFHPLGDTSRLKILASARFRV